MEMINGSATSNSPIKNDDSICEICKSQPSKYKCPRCHLRTCSVGCVKQHKLDQSCSGERSKTHYVPLKQYNESNMMSDYVYLEDISRCSDNMTRQRLAGQQFMKTDPKKKAIIKNARAAGIIYDMLPSGMSKNKLNRTNYSTKCRQIFWTIEFVFCFDDKKERVLEHSCIGVKTLREILNNMLFSYKPQGKNSYATIRYQARHFIEAGMEQWAIGLKKEGGGMKNKNTFTNLTTLLDDKITALLKYERIIEYPTIYVWLKDHMDPALQLVDKQKVDLSKQKDTTNIDVDEMQENTIMKEAEMVEVEVEGNDDNEEEEEEEEDDDDDDDDNDDNDDEEEGKEEKTNDDDEDEEKEEEKEEDDGDDILEKKDNSYTIDNNNNNNDNDKTEDENVIAQVEKEKDNDDTLANDAKENNINNVKNNAYDQQDMEKTN